MAACASKPERDPQNSVFDLKSATGSSKLKC